jgi:hypothetical protein
MLKTNLLSAMLISDKTVAAKVDRLKLRSNAQPELTGVSQQLGDVIA